MGSPTRERSATGVGDARRAGGGAAAAQRVRLVRAMLDTIAEKGYTSSTVADVIARAGVSRKTFYVHFENRAECALAAHALVTGQALRLVSAAYEDTAGGRAARAEAAIAALFAQAARDPGAVRLAVVDVGALGPPGIQAREESLRSFERFVSAALARSPEEGEVPDVVVTAVVGGIYRVLYRSLGAARGGVSRASLVPGLVAWATSYYPTPRSIVRAPAPAPRARREPADPGRAPGTLAPHRLLRDRRGLARGDQNVSRSFVVHNQRERILDAVANLVCSGGYAALTLEDVAVEAAVSLKAFYEHFADKEDAFLVAYEVGHAKLLASVERAFTAERDWRLAVRAGIVRLLEFLSEEPAFAHLAVVDALSATARAAERSRIGVNAFAEMLMPGLLDMPEGRQAPPVAIEAIAGGIFELCLEAALQGRIAELPALSVPAVYFALAPFIGRRAAAAVATSGA